MNSNELPDFSDAYAPTEYIIRVKGCLKGQNWSGWFGDMTVHEDEVLGETVLQGKVIDTTELYGLISRLRNLGLSLISVMPFSSNE